MLHPSVLNALEEIDAQMFTGFVEEADMPVIEEYVERWVRRIKEFKSIHAEAKKEEQPYLINEKIVPKRKYNPNYGDDRVCRCGHPYYRHFDSYEEMRPVGCKYCGCYTFKEKKEDKDVRKTEEVNDRSA